MLDSNSKRPKIGEEITQNDLIALWIAAENKSFSSVESKYFQVMFKSSSINFKIKSADFFRTKVKDHFTSKC
jgi:hypothetical protein